MARSRSCFEAPASVRPTSGASSCVLRGSFASKPQDAEPRWIAERLQQLDQLRRGRLTQPLDEEGRAVDDGQRPRRVAVDPDVRPGVDARNQQQRALGPDRHAMVVRNVQPEAAPARIDPQLRHQREQERVHAVARQSACPTARRSPRASARSAPTRRRTPRPSTSSSSDRKRSTRRAGSSNISAAARRDRGPSVPARLSETARTSGDARMRRLGGRAPPPWS